MPFLAPGGHVLAEGSLVQRGPWPAVDLQHPPCAVCRVSAARDAVYLAVPWCVGSRGEGGQTSLRRIRTDLSAGSARSLARSFVGLRRARFRSRASTVLHCSCKGPPSKRASPADARCSDRGFGGGALPSACPAQRPQAGRPLSRKGSSSSILRALPNPIQPNAIHPSPPSPP